MSCRKIGRNSRTRGFRTSAPPLMRTGRRFRSERDGSPRMTTREALHQLVDELPEDRAELAHAWLQDLRAAADEDGPPLPIGKGWKSTHDDTRSAAPACG